VAKDPAFLFYSSDFLVGTFTMTDAQVGQYIRLMCLQHQKGHLTEAMMMGVMGGTLDQDVLCKFVKDEDGLYYNERLKEESDKRAKYAESRRQNRLKPETSESHENHMTNICDSQSEHMENENVNVNIDTNSKRRNSLTYDNPAFKRFWDAYPKKDAKAAALKAFTKLNPDDVLLSVIHKAIDAKRNTEQWTKENGKFVPMASTWLNGRRWEDEVQTTQPAERRIRVLSD